MFNEFSTCWNLIEWMWGTRLGFPKFVCINTTSCRVIDINGHFDNASKKLIRRKQRTFPSKNSLSIFHKQLFHQHILHCHILTFNICLCKYHFSRTRTAECC